MLTKAFTWEYQASVFGAGFVGFGLGYVLRDLIGSYAIAIMILGIGLHGWGMYRISRRSKRVRVD